MIILRNDDILVDSAAGKYAGKEFQRLKFVHEQIVRTNGEIVHHPAIVCNELIKHPEALEYVKEEIKAKRMVPYLHGEDHTEDWTKKSENEIQQMLLRCDDWFWEHLEAEFSVWATPWGSKSDVAMIAAEKLGVTLQSTEPTIDIKDAGKVLAATGNANQLHNRIVLFHWWKRGLTLFRIVESCVYGGLDFAKVQTQNPEWYA